MKRFMQTGVKISLEDTDDYDIDDLESSDAIDESLSKASTAGTDSGDNKEGSEEPSESSDVEKTEETEVTSEPDEESVDTTETIETSEAEVSETTEEEPVEEEVPEKTLDDLPNNIEVSETEVSVDVKTPEEDGKEVSNKELALDMEEVGALEGFAETLNSSIINVPSNGNNLALLGLKLSYGLESFGLPSDFEIKTERDKNHLVNLLTSALDNAKGQTDSIGLEAASDSIAEKAKKLKEWLMSIVKAGIKMIATLIEKFKKFVKSMIETTKVRYNNIKKLAKKAKLDTDETFTYKPVMDNIEGCPFDKHGKNRIANVMKNLLTMKEVVNEYFSVFALIKTAISHNAFEINSSELVDKRFPEINKGINAIKETMNKDFGNIVSTTSTTLGVGHETAEVERLVVNRNFDHGIEVKLSTKDLISMVLSAEKDFNAAKDLGEKISALNESIWTASNQFKLELEKTNLDVSISDNLPEINSRIRGLHSLILMSNKNIASTTTFASKTLRGMGHFIQAAEAYLKTQADDIEIDQIPSIESFKEEGIEIANNVKDPVMCMTAMAYNLS